MKIAKLTHKEDKPKEDLSAHYTIEKSGIRRVGENYPRLIPIFMSPKRLKQITNFITRKNKP